MQHIITAQPAALPLALKEAGRATIARELSPGVALCDGAKTPQFPLFLRHICPAEVAVPLAGTMDDVAALLAAAQPLLLRLDGQAGGFSVQTRIIEGYTPAYKRFDVNVALSDAAVAQGAVLDVKHPALILSVTLAEGMGWLGLSRKEDNISDWAGGMRRYKWELGQISRAEFKLLEALETFGIQLEDGEHALDLGAAPGGWTRILRRRGLYVTAVDPAALDARIEKDKRVTHYRGTAQAYFRGRTSVCEIMVNDMKMDSAQSAQLMVEGAECLRPGRAAILTLKLPEAADEWMPRVEQAAENLEAAYDVAGMRQLFHNRSEVTAYLIRK